MSEDINPTLFGEPATEKPQDAAALSVLHPDWKAGKQYYSIGEVAVLFGLNTSTIRFWTKEFRLKVRTTRKGDRLYSPERIGDVRSIYQLVKEQGYTLAGAKAALKEGIKPITPPAVSQAPVGQDLQRALLSLRNRLVALRNQLS